MSITEPEDEGRDYARDMRAEQKEAERDAAKKRIWTAKKAAKK